MKKPVDRARDRGRAGSPPLNTGLRNFLEAKVELKSGLIERDIK